MYTVFSVLLFILWEIFYIQLCWVRKPIPKMAAAFELSSLVLDDVEVTGRELGRGAYGVVYEVRVSGLVCAGKKLHDVIIQVY